MQAGMLDRLGKEGKVCVEKLGETGADMRRTKSVTPAAALTVYEDWAHDGSEPEKVCRTVWYSSANYRANLLLRGNRLIFRDIYKFDDRYTERYLDTPCRQWKATYDNLPLVDGRLWSTEGKHCEIAVEFSVASEGFTCVEHDQTMEVVIPFENGKTGRIWLSPDYIKAEGCGALTYTVGTPADTEICCRDDGFVAKHNGYEYRIPLTGCVVETMENGCRLVPADWCITLDMAAR